jgi:hypothetical protein
MVHKSLLDSVIAHGAEVHRCTVSLQDIQLLDELIRDVCDNHPDSECSSISTSKTGRVFMKYQDGTQEELKPVSCVNLSCLL